jgi:hypothetical protein
MKGFIDSLIQKHKISAVTSAPANSDLLRTASSDAIPLSPEKHKDLHSTIAKLLYLAIHSRPDILFPVNHLTSHVKNLTTRLQQRGCHANSSSLRLLFRMALLSGHVISGNHSNLSHHILFSSSLVSLLVAPVFESFLLLEVDLELLEAFFQNVWYA